MTWPDPAPLPKPPKRPGSSFWLPFLILVLAVYGGIQLVGNAIELLTGR